MHGRSAKSNRYSMLLAAREKHQESWLWSIDQSGQIRWRSHMRSMIQALSGAGMVLAVSLVGMPASAHAQYTSSTPAVSTTTQIHHHRVVTHRTHILCGDGTWARYGNPDCRGHDGVASRQITTTTTVNPGGVGVATGYGTNSTVVRGYSNDVR